MASKHKIDKSGSRQRNLLSLLLKRTTSGDRQGLTLEQIVDQLLEDREGADGRIFRELAYGGKSVEAYRQMFHRDRDDLADNGVEVIETLGRYTIEPTHVWVSGLNLTHEESRLLLELRCSIGRPFGPNGLLQSTPMKRATGSRFGAKAAAFGLAKQQKRAVTFEFAKPGFWRRKGVEMRTFVPLRFVVSGHRRYVVGYDVSKCAIRGFLMDRVLTVPKFASKEVEQKFELGTTLVDEAKHWVPQQYQDGLTVDFVTSNAFAQYAITLFGPSVSQVVETTRGTKVSMIFESEDGAFQFFISHASHIRSISTRKFSSALKAWLIGVNPSSSLEVSKLKLSTDFDLYDNALLETLSMISAILNSDGLYASDLAERFSVPIEFLTENVTKAIMARDPLDDAAYLVPVEFGDLEDELNPLYVPVINASNASFGGDSPLTWSEVLDVQIMLSQILALGLHSGASALYGSLRSKIHEATDVGVTVYSPTTPFVDTIEKALGTNIVHLNYQTEGSNGPTDRAVVPTEIQMVLGDRYIHGIDISQDSPVYRTYNLSRVWGVSLGEPFDGNIPVDTSGPWLDQMLAGASKVLVAVSERALPIWENLPRAAIDPEVQEGVHVIEVLVANQAFLDRRLAMSGPFASVLRDSEARSGLDFANSLIQQLGL
ncbi:MAG: WYL domain-containing protein [Actinobacteria bacterium]|nr:WYL domain-containing protein [Actinomycetota bacterium]